MWQKEKVRFKHSWIKKQPYKKSFKVSHTLDGLSSLLDFIKEVEDVSGGQPPIVLESTGHYHTPIVQYFEDRGYLLIIVNPLYRIGLRVLVYAR
jgi:transposase